MALTASLLLVALWAVSQRRGLAYRASTWSVGAGDGCIRLIWNAQVPLYAQGWTVWQTEGLLGFVRPSVSTAPSPFSFKMLLVPLWVPIAFFVILALWVRFGQRTYDLRHPLGHCQGCGYDLTGIPTSVCPECGEVNVTWTAVEQEQFEAILADEVTALSADTREALGRFQVTPWLAPTVHHGETRHVYVIAQHGRSVAYHADADRHFAVGTLDADGVVHRSSPVTAFDEAVRRFFDQLETKER